MEEYDYRKEHGLTEEIDDLTRYRMKTNEVKNLDHSIALAFMVGVFCGIVLASFLHKYIVHPLGW